MAIGVITVERPEAGASYLRATLKGMTLTIKKTQAVNVIAFVFGYGHGSG